MNTRDSYTNCRYCLKQLVLCCMVVIVMRDTFNDDNTTSSSSSSSSSSCCSPRSELSESARAPVSAQLTDALAASVPQRQQQTVAIRPAVVALRSPAPANAATSKPLSSLIEGLTQRSATLAHSAGARGTKSRDRLAATVPGPSRPAVGGTAKAAVRANNTLGTRERVLVSDDTPTTAAVTPVSAADSCGDDALGFTKSSTATTGELHT
jgi:hypothetical protein